MRIGLFGDGPWARETLTGLAASDALQVGFVVGRHAAPDGELAEQADRLGIPFVTVPDVNGPSFLERVRRWAPDVNASMSFDQILRRPLLEVAPGGFVNCHAGALPFYRGRNVLNWALINGEGRIGVTVHHIDEGIDTGDIILQRFFDVGADDDYAVVLERATHLCAMTLLDALHQIAAGSATRTPQERVHPVGAYRSRRRQGDEWIDWTWSSGRIHDFVRAIAPPGPGARAVLGGDVIAVTRTRPIPEAPVYIDRPGTVVGKDERGIVVKTGDSTIRVTEVATVVAGDALAERRIPTSRIGTVLAVNPWQELVRLRERVEALERRQGGDS